ncbi:MAG: hypothetical protein Q9P01_15190 [Anaerolineae bacterium]|nr:hypothetical protein [Anaerolineae bacterium]
MVTVLFFHSSTQAQDITLHTWEVYLQQGITNDGADRLIFMDILTGDVTSAQVFGERYTPFGDKILFFDPVNRSVMTINTIGTVTAHPFIQLGTARRVDWVFSAEQRFVAWTLTYDDADGLRTVTQVATPDGMNQRVVFEEGARSDGLRALPIAFSVDSNALIMDFHPDIISAFAPYTQYAGLFRLSLADSNITALPDDDTPCFCSAALRAGQLVRLSVTSDLSGFDVLFFDLASSVRDTIDAIPLNGFTQAGNILISPDGRRAVYAMSQVPNFSVSPPEIRTVLMSVNLDTMTQEQVSDPITRYLRPIRWTEDNSAILFISPDRDGIWKINLADGELTRVAEATFIGVLHSN